MHVEMKNMETNELVDAINNLACEQQTTNHLLRLVLNALDELVKFEQGKRY